MCKCGIYNNFQDDKFSENNMHEGVETNSRQSTTEIPARK